MVPMDDADGDRVDVITRYRELEHWKDLIEENKTYTLYNCHVFDNDIAFNLFKVVFGSDTKVHKYDKLTNVLTHEFRFKSFKEIQDGKFKTDILYDIVMYCQDNTNWDWKETRKYKRRLITAERASYGKYLGGLWINFCKARVMIEGGKLIFGLEKSPKNLHVQVVLK
ncbi:hypothetical protein MTR_5g044110 [Medicago truncatula]|uniref:Uncharacterized protein n=1 Tax=Medicago truncatula TaxID=3880 RepID=G7JWS9_MEDTR|nr:hypothetical protein MTR_5g044110 [Medicago truncatula]